MTNKIDYQKLREIAEKTKIAGETPVMPFDQRINALNDFMKHFSPDIALALLDEVKRLEDTNIDAMCRIAEVEARERNQQYIKRRDQENEEIALTVGKLRVELEAAENNLIDSECHVAELEEALRDKQALLEASEKRNAKLQSENAYIRNRYKELDLLIGKNILVMQAAIIEWQATGDAKSGLVWIYNTLFGPGELPDESEKDAQAYFNRKYAPIDEKLMALHKWFWEQSEAERAAGIRIKGE